MTSPQNFVINYTRTAELLANVPEVEGIIFFKFKISFKFSFLIYFNFN